MTEMLGFPETGAGRCRVMRTIVSSILMAAVLASGVPAMAQSRGILESVQRLAVEARARQDRTFVQRRRSGTLAAVGAVLAATGVVLVLQPPKCLLEGGPAHDEYDVHYEAVYRVGRCDLRASGDISWPEYQSDGPLLGLPHDFSGRTAGENRMLNYVGWSTLGAGGALLWYGLRQVEVPFRVDLGMGGGIAVSRSFGW
ncbi:MAG: hypothetical protein OXG35_16900 [Acidobacteria bacterium]|nr:hypothetical protein [Acidobacteriota bacterium]